MSDTAKKMNGKDPKPNGKGKGSTCGSKCSSKSKGSKAGADAKGTAPMTEATVDVEKAVESAPKGKKANRSRAASIASSKGKTPTKPFEKLTPIAEVAIDVAVAKVADKLEVKDDVPQAKSASAAPPKAPSSVGSSCSDDEYMICNPNCHAYHRCDVTCSFTCAVHYKHHIPCLCHHHVHNCNLHVCHMHCIHHPAIHVCDAGVDCRTGGAVETTTNSKEIKAEKIVVKGDITYDVRAQAKIETREIFHCGTRYQVTSKEVVQVARPLKVHHRPVHHCTQVALGHGRVPSTPFPCGTITTPIAAPTSRQFPGLRRHKIIELNDMNEAGMDDIVIPDFEDLHLEEMPSNCILCGGPQNECPCPGASGSGTH